jgi:hypothetical protein
MHQNDRGYYFMEFFYIDYMNGTRKERNVGFLRVEEDGINVGLRGVPSQCREGCTVYATNVSNEKVSLGNMQIKGGYGMEKFGWKENVDINNCARVEIPFYGNRKGVCVLRSEAVSPAKSEVLEKKPVERQDKYSEPVDEIVEDKWQQLMNTYPEVHISLNAESILIKPKDTVILTSKYHSLATNSFLLHAYYNYRQLLLFRYGTEPEYYLGVPGIYYEREQRIAKLFGFEGFENGEARMREDSDNRVYDGCFGYYMKRVEI